MKRPSNFCCPHGVAPHPQESSPLILLARDRPVAHIRVRSAHRRPAAANERAEREGAAQQRDAADEGRLDAYGNIVVGPVIVNHGKVVRPSQLIAGVRRTRGGERWR